MIRCKCGSTNFIEAKGACLNCLTEREQVTYIDAREAKRQQYYRAYGGVLTLNEVQSWQEEWDRKHPELERWHQSNLEYPKVDWVGAPAKARGVISDAQYCAPLLQNELETDLRRHPDGGRCVGEAVGYCASNPRAVASALRDPTRAGRPHALCGVEKVATVANKITRAAMMAVVGSMTTELLVGNAPRPTETEPLPPIDMVPKSELNAYDIMRNAPNYPPERLFVSAAEVADLKSVVQALTERPLLNVPGHFSVERDPIVVVSVDLFADLPWSDVKVHRG